MTTSLADPQAFQNSLDRDQQALQRAGLRPLPAVSDPPPLYLVAPEGQLQVHTAPYRGSFANVLSQAMRAAGLGSRVLISQFLKPRRRLVLALSKHHRWCQSPCGM